MTDTLDRPILRIDPDAAPLQPLGLSPDDFQSPLPVQNYRTVFEDKTIGLAVGIWDTTTMQEAFGPYPSDEFITVLDGRFAILDGAGGAVEGHAGQSATFRMGIPVSWKQEGYLRKVYLTLHDPEGAMPRIPSAEGGVQVFDAARPPAAPGPDGTRRELLFRNDRRTMTLWHCAWPGGPAPDDPGTAHRLIRVLRGALTLTDASGRTVSFGPGDHAFLPAGTPCGWQAAEDTQAFVVEVTAA